MRNPFAGEEIGKAAKKLKNGKSTGPDEVQLEMTKYAPQAEEIAKIYNKVAKDGDELTDLKLGLLRPLQKPGKFKGPAANLRPIILLSVVKKIMTICLIKRT